MLLEEVNQLLKPGYLPVETGCFRLPNGQMHIANLTRMPGCRSEWVDWWFGTYLKDSKRFNEWDPDTHLALKRDKKWMPGQYIGTSDYAEFLLGGNIFKFRFVYEDPAKYFDTSRLPEIGIGAVICGEILLPDGTSDGRIIRIVRETDDGCEMRTRLWINRTNEESAMERFEHDISSMGRLGDILKKLMGTPGTTDIRGSVRCKFCHSGDVVKNGIRNNTQYWLCRNCGRGFVFNQTWPKMKYPIRVVAAAVLDYYAGISIRNICRGIEYKIGYLPSTSSVYEWIKKLTEIALDKSRDFHPLVGDRWLAADLEISVNGEGYWLISIIDMETRFILATTVSRSRSEVDIRSLMVSASKRARSVPKELVTSGNHVYLDAAKLCYGADAPNIRLSEYNDDDLSEYLGHGWYKTLADRLKPGSGEDIHKSTRILLDGFIFYYNYIRINESLDKTPAQAARTEVNFKSWQDIFIGYRNIK